MNCLCPNCGSDTGFQPHHGAGMCPDTGYDDGAYLACLNCGAETDSAEIERCNAKPSRIAPRMAGASLQERTEDAA